MPPTDNRFNIGCLTILFLVIGTWHIVISLIAFQHGTDVLYGKGTKVHMSPWFTLVLGIIFLVVGLAGAYKTYKDKDKYPF
jgi:putative effector of murein hydrolase